MGKKLKKLFFGLLPPESVRQTLNSLNQTHRQLGARPASVGNLHLTLHYIGPSAEVDCLLRRATDVNLPEFTLQLCRWGLFRKPQILWLGPDAPNPVLCRLAQQCRELAGQGQSATDDGDFRPHVTLQRKVKALPDLPDIAAIPWRVTSYHLFESVGSATGVVYHSLGSFRLAAASTAMQNS